MAQNPMTVTVSESAGTEEKEMDNYDLSDPELDEAMSQGLFDIPEVQSESDAPVERDVVMITRVDKQDAASQRTTSASTSAARGGAGQGKDKSGVKPPRRAAAVAANQRLQKDAGHGHPARPPAAVAAPRLEKDGHPRPKSGKAVAKPSRSSGASGKRGRRGSQAPVTFNLYWK